MMNTTTKQNIATAMLAFIADQGLTENNFAEKSGINKSYINSIKHAKWDSFDAGGKQVSIADKWFEKLAIFIGYEIETNYWYHFESDNYLQGLKACNKARRSKERAGIDGYSGSGKSYTVEACTKANLTNTYLVKCSGDMNAKDFMIALAKAVGADAQGSKFIIRKAVVAKLQDASKGLLIIDEAENIKKEAVLDAVKGICDDLEGKCGVVLAGMNIKAIFAKNAERQKFCYPQLNRRFKGNWYTMFALGDADINQVCGTLKIDSSGAKQWLLRNVNDWGHLASVVARACEKRASTGNAITAEMLKIQNP
jgi:AAA domain